MTEETTLLPQDLISPIFLLDGNKIKRPINSMPNQYKFSADMAIKEIENCMKNNIYSFILFPIVANKFKDSQASYSYTENNFYIQAIHLFKQKFPEICIITDVAMDPYSSDGHDGLVKNNEILNDETLPILAKMSLAQARAGSDILAPSDMMDGRVQYLRTELDKNGFKNIGIMSYSVKYASSFYGPFRKALDSTPLKGDKRTYQMSPYNQKEALVEAKLDYEEGADFLMVKPALHYLDIIHLLKTNFTIPIIGYHVSGEYAMLKLAIDSGLLQPKEAIEETLCSIKRAGADAIISYFAKEYAQYLKNQSL